MASSALVLLLPSALLAPAAASRMLHHVEEAGLYDHSKRFCLTAEAELACEAGTVLDVFSAFTSPAWGHRCGLPSGGAAGAHGCTPDLTDWVRSLCQGRRSCALPPEAHPACSQPPQHSVRVAWSCVPGPASEVEAEKAAVQVVEKEKISDASGQLWVRFIARCGWTHYGQDLRVVGSTSNLGSWAPHSSPVVLHTTDKDFPTWSSDWISVPSGQRGFEYKYVITGPNGFIKWEEPLDNRLWPPAELADWQCRGACRLTVSEDFGTSRFIRLLESDEVEQEGRPVDAPGQLWVRFVARCSRTFWGQDLRVVGSTAMLGNWTPHSSSVVLNTSAKDFPTWASDWIPMPVGQRGFEYKYVITHPDGHKLWEENYNRRWPPEEMADWKCRGACRLTISEDFGALSFLEFFKDEGKAEEGASSRSELRFPELPRGAAETPSESGEAEKSSHDEAAKFFWFERKRPAPRPPAAGTRRGVKPFAWW